MFRGITLDQGDNRLYSNALDRLDDLDKPYFIDIHDRFGRDVVSLEGSDVDTFQIGFVPPTDGVPDGPLEGQNAIDHGRWSYGSDFATVSADGGYARRTTLDGDGVAATPWRVEPKLGDYYLLEFSARVAAGEMVSFGYLGDIETVGITEGLAGELGQLVLGVRRGVGGEATQLTWTVSWRQNGTSQSLSSTLTAGVDEELNLQLGWLDGRRSTDLFDAWLRDSTGDTRLIQGNLNASIDVYDVGFYSSGLESTVHSFTAAVPEPQAYALQLMGLSCLLLPRRRLAL